MHDERLHLTLPVGKKSCRPDVSPGVLCLCLGSLMSRRRNLGWAMSWKSDSTTKTFWLLSVQELPENELAIVSASVRWWVAWYIFCHLSEAHLRPGIAWKWTSDRLSNEGIYLLEDRVMETNSKAAVRGLILIFSSPSVWRTSESRNCLKTLGRSFLQLQSIATGK